MRILTIILLLLGVTVFAEVTQDDVSGMKKIAEQKDFQGALYSYLVGDCYYEGKGVIQDYKEAVKWLLRSAEMGNPVAQIDLGRCYFNGQGIKKDKVEAYAWFILAGITNQDARDYRERAAKKMTQEEIELGQVRAKELQKEIQKTNVWRQKK
jgi:TPR repeat protein